MYILVSLAMARWSCNAPLCTGRTFSTKCRDALLVHELPLAICFDPLGIPFAAMSRERNYMPVGFDGREPPAQILCQSSLLQFAVAVISIDVARNKNTRFLQWRESGQFVYLFECDV